MLEFFANIFFVLPVAIAVLTVVSRGYSKMLEKDQFYMPANAKRLVLVAWVGSVLGFLAVGAIGQPMFREVTAYWLIGTLIAVISGFVSFWALEKPLRKLPI